MKNSLQKLSFCMKYIFYTKAVFLNIIFIHYTKKVRPKECIDSKNIIILVKILLFNNRQHDQFMNLH